MNGVQAVHTSRGSVVHVETTGEGPAVLAIHGVGGGAYFLQGFAARLADRYQVTVVDLPGTGYSTGSGTLEFSHWVSDLGDVLTHHIKRPVVLVGHSLGTILALALWQRHAPLIRAMVFVGGLPAPNEGARQRLRDRVAALSTSLAGWGARVSPAVFSPRTRRDHPEMVACFERLLESQDPATYRRSLELLADADASAIVPTVTVPCASVSGADDQYAPPAEVAAFLARLPHPAASIVMPGVGHLPFFEAPAAFASVVAGFLGTLPDWHQ